MNEKSHQTLSSPGTISRLFWLFGKHSQNGSPVEKERRVGWTRMPFFSKTVEGSVWTLVQDVRSWADGCFSPARLLPRGHVFTWKGSVPAGRQVFCAPPTGCAWRPGSCTSSAAWKLMAFLVFLVGIGSFPAKGNTACGLLFPEKHWISPHISHRRMYIILALGLRLGFLSTGGTVENCLQGQWLTT